MTRLHVNNIFICIYRPQITAEIQWFVTSPTCIHRPYLHISSLDHRLAMQWISSSVFYAKNIFLTLTIHSTFVGTTLYLVFNARTAAVYLFFLRVQRGPSWLFIDPAPHSRRLIILWFVSLVAAGLIVALVVCLIFIKQCAPSRFLLPLQRSWNSTSHEDRRAAIEIYHLTSSLRDRVRTGCWQYSQKRILIPQLYKLLL